jgi:hypothetical protein
MELLFVIRKRRFHENYLARTSYPVHRKQNRQNSVSMDATVPGVSLYAKHENSGN